MEIADFFPPVCTPSSNTALLIVCLCVYVFFLIIILHKAFRSINRKLGGSMVYLERRVILEMMAKSRPVLAHQGNITTFTAPRHRQKAMWCWLRFPRQNDPILIPSVSSWKRADVGANAEGNSSSHLCLHKALVCCTVFSQGRRSSEGRRTGIYWGPKPSAPLSLIVLWLGEYTVPV